MSAELEEDAVTDDAPPLLAGRYRLEGMLGSGGMGTVYLARDVELDELVALKILSRLDDKTIAKFRDEVKLARRVTHRHVARTFDIGEHEGGRFLTMEYVRGETLSRLIARGPLAPARAFELAGHIAEGLAAIHAEEVVHGDLKPANVLVGEGGAKVSDFGLARVAAPRASSGPSPGTPEYMAPEQFIGGSADPRADVHALGSVLFELFAGRRPWLGTRSEVLGKKLLGAAPEGATGAPPDVDALIRRCLAFEPAARPANGAEVGAALARMAAPPAAAGSGVRALATKATRPERGASRVAIVALRAATETDAYLGLAFASDLGRMLATAAELEVVGPPFPAGDETAERVGRSVDADVVIEGGVFRAGSSVRIGLRLLSVDDGFLLWGRSVTVALGDVFAELEAASSSIAQALSAKPARRRSPLALADPELLDLYLRARRSDGDFWHDADFDQCELYAELLRRAPDEPLLLASFASSSVMVAYRVPGGTARARDAAERAIRGAPDLAEASFGLGLVLFMDNEMEGTARAIVRALELSPSLPSAHSVLGQLLTEVGRPDEGLARLELAMRLDPRLTIAWSNAVRVLSFAADPARCDELLAKGPAARSPVNEWLAWITRLRVAVSRGDAAARTMAADLEASELAAVPNLAVMKRALERRASSEEVRAALENAFSLSNGSARPRTFALTLNAEMAMFLGDEAAALASIADAESVGFVDLTWLDRSPMLQPLRARGALAASRARSAASAARVLEALAAAGLDLR